MKESLNGKIAIVTGGSKGYGYGIAKVLKSKGADVWITSRHEEELQKVSSELGVSYFVADVTDSKDWDKLVDAVIEKDGKVDILVNNAGGGVSINNIDEQSDEDIETSIALNLTGAILGCKRVVPHMKKAKTGIIINISSICDQEAWPGYSVYSAAKAGLLQFAKCLITEVQNFGIRVTHLTPSWGDTEFRKAAGQEEMNDEVTAKITTPEELGEIVASICELPKHLDIHSMTVVPTVQKIMPL